jgi:hypothetical protein
MLIILSLCLFLGYRLRAVAANSCSLSIGDLYKRTDAGRYPEHRHFAPEVEGEQAPSEMVPPELGQWGGSPFADLVRFCYARRNSEVPCWSTY